MPAEWKEATMTILHKKEDTKDIKNTGPSICFPTYINCSHGLYKTEWKMFLRQKQQENRPVSEKVTRQLIINQPNDRKIE